jgi:methionyl-tRNA formyltransferase
MIRIFIITQEEPFFVPKMISFIAEKAASEGFEVAGVTVLKPYRKNRSFSQWISERTQIYTAFELGLVGLGFVAAKLKNKLSGNQSSYSVSGVCAKKNVALFHSTDINSQEFIEHIKKLKVDIIVSISCPQLFQPPLLSTPKLACINAHGTLLPKHRGVFGSWWMLFENDPVGGSTIHTMVPEVDKGDILWQKEFDITSRHTQYRIAYQTKKDMASGIVEVINHYKNGVSQILQPKHKSSYHYAPGRKLGQEFHRRNKKILVIDDLRLMLAKEFQTDEV